MNFFKRKTDPEPKPLCWHSSIEFADYRPLYMGPWFVQIWYGRKYTEWNGATTATVYQEKYFDTPEEAEAYTSDWGRQFELWCQYLKDHTKHEVYCT